MSSLLPRFTDSFIRSSQIASFELNTECKASFPTKETLPALHRLRQVREVILSDQSGILLIQGILSYKVFKIMSSTPCKLQMPNQRISWSSQDWFLLKELVETLRIEFFGKYLKFLCKNPSVKTNALMKE